MIRPFLWSLFALAVGAGLALLLVSDPGYILVHDRGYSIEATLVTVLVTLIIFSGISYAMSWLLRNANPLHPGGLVKIFAFDGCFLREKPNK